MNELKNEEIKFNTICEEWLAFKKNKVKQSTYLNYKFIINKHLQSNFGDKTLEYFKSYDLNEYIDNLKQSLVNKTIRDIISVLKSILRYSERKYDMDFKLDLVSCPMIYPREIEVFNEKEKQKLEKYLLASENLKDLGILISLFSGLRIGEVCSLKWSNIDLESKLIYVNHTMQRIYISKNKTKVIVTEPKTKKSIRKIPISKTLYNKLKQIGSNHSKDDYILTRRYRKVYRTSCL